MTRFNLIRVDVPLARQGAADASRGILLGYLRQPVTTVDMRSRQAASISFLSLILRILRKSTTPQVGGVVV